MPKARRQTRAARLRNKSQPIASENLPNIGNEGVVRVTRGMSRISLETPSTNSTNTEVRNMAPNIVPNNSDIDTVQNNWSELRRHETPVQMLQNQVSELSLGETRNPEKISKVVRDLIPEFNGRNMSARMFVRHCRAVVSMVLPQKIPYLTMLIVTKITGEVRKLIQDSPDINLNESLKILEQVYSQQEDLSQLMQQLATVKRSNSETVPEYAARVNQILNKLINRVLENTPGERGFVRCEAFKETAIGNFLRGLEREIFVQVSENGLNTLEQAIALATEAELRLESWEWVHNKNQPSKFESERNYEGKSENKFVSRRRVAHLQTDFIKNDRVESPKERIQCFNCKEFGHIRRECQKSTKRKFAGDREEQGCHYCHKDNHKILNCRMKQKHDQERANSKRLKTMPLNYKKGRLNGGAMTPDSSLSQNAELSSNSTNTKI